MGLQRGEEEMIRIIVRVIDWAFIILFPFAVGILGYFFARVIIDILTR